MKQLILIRGLPGSGKSTLAKVLAYDFSDIVPVTHLEADMFFINENGEYKYNPSMIAGAHEWCRQSARDFLDDNEDCVVIVSNTFTTKKELKPYFGLGEIFGITPVVYLAQNQFQNVHNVPQEVMCKMRTRFEYDISDLFKDHIV